MEGNLLWVVSQFVVIVLAAIAAILAAGFGVVWLATAVILGVFETRRARRERDAESRRDLEDPSDISLL
ncbi:hypothetical protein [Microbacterium natoriense]